MVSAKSTCAAQSDKYNIILHDSRLARTCPSNTSSTVHLTRESPCEYLVAKVDYL